MHFLIRLSDTAPCTEKSRCLKRDTVQDVKQPVGLKGSVEVRTAVHFFSHAAGVRAKWDNENISGFARRPDGLREHVPYPPVLPSPADLTACQHPRPQQIHHRSHLIPVSRRTIQSPRPQHSPAQRTPHRSFLLYRALAPDGAWGKRCFNTT